MILVLSFSRTFCSDMSVLVDGQGYLVCLILYTSAILFAVGLLLESICFYFACFVLNHYIQNSLLLSVVF